MGAVTGEIIELIEERKWPQLRTRLADWDIQEIVDELDELDKTQRVMLFRALPRHLSSDVFSYIEPEHQDGLLRDLTDAETRQILSSMSPDDRTALLEELPAKVTRRLLNLLDADDLKEARLLLGYPEESVGRLMTPDYVSIRPEWTIGGALDHIRTAGIDSETINRIYVTDEGGQLLDDIILRRLIIANPNEPVTAVMDRAFISLSAFDDREVAVVEIQRYDVVALPVVDSDGSLLGIVTVDDVLDVAEEEATEDIQKAASVAPLKMSYHRAGILDLYYKRMPWLAILVMLTLFSSAVIAAFEERLEKAIVLVFFLPILLGSGGNTGSQSATLMLRGLVTGDIEMSEWFRTLGKEFFVGLLLGITLGLLSLALGIMRGGWNIGLVVGCAMVATVMVANIVGMVLPFLLAHMKFDPAVASSPLITTIVDTTGLLIYFTIAVHLLGL